jgi:DNA-binding transcriptional ArsR family regulator
MGERNAEQLDAVFVAMADPTRRAILQRLSHAEARVTELASEFPISLNSTSKHIRMLERAGLVQRRIAGRDHFLSLDAAPMAEAAAVLEHYRRFWDARLAALDAFVTRKRKADKKGKPT